MDVNKHDEQPSEMPTLGIAPGTSESLEASIRRAQEALSAVSARLASRTSAAARAAERTTECFVEVDAMPPAEARAVAERCIAGEPTGAANMARAFSALLGQIDALQADHAGRRHVLRQWMVSQLTYKMLYLHHTGQDSTLSPRALRAQKDQVKAQISALLEAGRSYADVRLTDLRFADDGGAGGQG